VTVLINIEKARELLKLTKGKTIVAATKYGNDKDISTLIDIGINNIGENRVKSFLEKKDLLEDKEIIWHFIGHLQSKKVKQMINEIDFLHSLDRISLLEEIQKYRKTPLKCFIEVNISKEESKYGLKPSDVITFFEKTLSYDRIIVVGLMGMATYTDDELLIKQQFKKLVDLKQEINKISNHNIEYLSMGMTNDYKIALEAGSTHLRLGSILFKKEE